MEAISLSEGRKRLFELRQTVVDNQEQVILTHKQGNVVLISMDEWETFRETLRLLNDKAALKALVESFEAHDAGLTTGKTIAEIFNDLP